MKFILQCPIILRVSEEDNQGYAYWVKAYQS